MDTRRRAISCCRKAPTRRCQCRQWSKYAYGQGKSILTVTKEGERLFAQLTGQPKFEIFPKSESEFFWKAVNAQITFVKDDKGKVVKGIHRQGGVTFDAPKIE